MVITGKTASSSEVVVLPALSAAVGFSNSCGEGAGFPEKLNNNNKMLMRCILKLIHKVAVRV